MQTTVQNLLSSAYGHVQGLLAHDGDGNIEHGLFDWQGNEGFTLQVWNTNNHKTTYGVLGVAIQALQRWVNSNDYMKVDFDIYDGANKVGRGRLCDRVWGRRSPSVTSLLRCSDSYVPL